MGIIVKNVLVEAHNFIGIIKNYHWPLQRVYFIIITEIPGIKSDLMLQISFKAINNLVGLHGLVSTLLVFDTYPRITKIDTSSPSIIQCPMAMQKAINEVQRYTAFQQINNTLNTLNGLSTTFVHNLPIYILVLVY